MALYDQRTFRWKNSWWVGEVHSAFGAGWGDAPPSASTERVIFTSLSDPDLTSRSVSIPAGFLNRLTHLSIGRLLESADEFGTRFAMSPRNAPDADELSNLQSFQDEGGLTWVFRKVVRPLVAADGTRMSPALELICLDDSALHGEVSFSDDATADDFVNTHGTDAMQALIPFITKDKTDLRLNWNR